MPAHREAVLRMLQDAKPDVVCLQETKLQDIPATLAAEFLGQHLLNYKFLPAQRTRGRILVAWDDDQMETHRLVLRDYSLTVNIKMRGTQQEFVLTVVYGPTDDRDKQAFLEEIKGLKPASGTPWAVVGDFNQIYEAQDKNNMNLNICLMGCFRQALDRCELIEIALHNRRYTWSNEREDPTMCRLDSVFAPRNGTSCSPPCCSRRYHLCQTITLSSLHNPNSLQEKQSSGLNSSGSRFLAL